MLQLLERLFIDRTSHSHKLNEYRTHWRRNPTSYFGCRDGDPRIILNNKIRLAGHVTRCDDARVNDGSRSNHVTDNRRPRCVSHWATLLAVRGDAMRGERRKELRTSRTSENPAERPRDRSRASSRCPRGCFVRQDGRRFFSVAVCCKQVVQCDTRRIAVRLVAAPSGEA